MNEKKQHIHGCWHFIINYTILQDTWLVGSHTLYVSVSSSHSYMLLWTNEQPGHDYGLCCHTTGRVKTRCKQGHMAYISHNYLHVLYTKTSLSLIQQLILTDSYTNCRYSQCTKTPIHVGTQM